MSPDASPVKEAPPTLEANAMFEEALDKAANLIGITTSPTDEADNGEDAEDKEAVDLVSPAKKRAKLEAGEEVLDATTEEGETLAKQEDTMKADPAPAEGDISMTAEATSTTVQAGGETVTTTTVKLERATTPPPPSSSAIPPSTPISSADVIPINIISPRTPNTPGSNLIFTPKVQLASPSRQQYEDEEVAAANQGPIHEKIIQPIGRFEKITIWNPDMELDRGDDCYVRALNEWTKLAELVSRLFLALFVLAPS